MIHRTIQELSYNFFYTHDDGDDSTLVRVGWAGVTMIEEMHTLSEHKRWVRAHYEDGTVTEFTNINWIKYEAEKKKGEQ